MGDRSQFMPEDEFRAEDDDGVDEFDPRDNPALTGDAVFALLSERLVRYALHYLETNAEPVADLDGLVKRLHAWDDDTDRQILSPESTVEIELVHTYLPMLADADLVEFDAQSGQVRYFADEKLSAALDLAANWDFPESAERR
jgi:hypothetical protein